MNKKKKDINIEKALEELEKIVEKLESGNLSLEESLKSIEKGISLTRKCRVHLSEAELKVKKLIEENGDMKTGINKDG